VIKNITKKCVKKGVYIDVFTQRKILLYTSQHHTPSNSFAFPQKKQILSQKTHLEKKSKKNHVLSKSTDKNTHFRHTLPATVLTPTCETKTTSKRCHDEHFDKSCKKQCGKSSPIQQGRILCTYDEPSTH
jgi:predicted 2-oxoglutarate/Fe(II)-dependent dioxygenase YbiX